MDEHTTFSITIVTDNTLELFMMGSSIAASTMYIYKTKSVSQTIYNYGAGGPHSMIFGRLHQSLLGMVEKIMNSNKNRNVVN